MPNPPWRSCGEIVAKASTKASSKAGPVRGLSARKRAFPLDQACAIGFRSGAYGGRNRSPAPAASRASAMSSSLGMEALSISPIAPQFKVGTSSSSTKKSLVSPSLAPGTLKPVRTPSSPIAPIVEMVPARSPGT